MSRTRKILAAAGIAAIALPLLPMTATASEPTVQADVDGDGRPDTVSLRQVSDSTMLLRVGLRDQFVDTEVTGNARGQSPRAVDLNGDGVDEVMVPESVGANTITYTTWHYDQGLNRVNTTAGEPWRVAEGGGASAVSRYECVSGEAGREVSIVSATQRPSGDYEGERVRYSVHDGVAHWVHEAPVRAADREDPALQADPTTCAPMS